MQKIIKCTVSGEYVRGSGVVAGAAGSHNDVVLELAFRDIWAGTTKTAFWWDANGENPTATILTLAMLVPGETEVYRVPIPAEAKAFEGQMKLTLRGVVLSESGIVEQQATVSADAYFDILPGSVPDEYAESMVVTPSAAEQIQAGIDALKGEFLEAQDAERQAIEAAQNAEKSADEAEDAAEAAVLAQENAERSKALALQARDRAEAAAGRAETAAESAKNYGKENAGKLLYVGADGIATVLAIGAGLKIVNGALTIDGIMQINTSVLGRARLGNMILNRGV